MICITPWYIVFIVVFLIKGAFIKLNYLHQGDTNIDLTPGLYITGMHIAAKRCRMKGIKRIHKEKYMPHIFILYNVISMFYIDFGDFPKDPHLFGF
jgi:hypothetical protein